MSAISAIPLEFWVLQHMWYQFKTNYGGHVLHNKGTWSPNATVWLMDVFLVISGQ